MRGLGDHLTIGERIAFYRKRREYTQAVLAGLVGRSTDWLARVESGRRKPPGIDMLAELARSGTWLGSPCSSRTRSIRMMCRRCVTHS
ncbi:helix-turn-helix domain-containing protein [Streptomyces lydicus]|uniref:helix-turn-helix domain-containing protein n=1 Tax=Streptomyces lydicus TaxID=47763 RepID=UPI0037B2B978